MGCVLGRRLRPAALLWCAATRRYHQERLAISAWCLAPPPAKAGGGWEGVVTVRADPTAPLPNPPPTFVGEGAKLAASAAPTGSSGCAGVRAPRKAPLHHRNPPPSSGHAPGLARTAARPAIGRASVRERGCQNV